MSRRNRFCSIAPMATFDAVFVGSGINSLVGSRAARPRRLERLHPRAQRRGRRLHQDVDRPHAAGLHARGARVLAPALHRLGSVCRAEGRARPARRDVRQHRPAHRDGVSRRLGGVHHRLAGGQRGGVRTAGAGRRGCVGAPVQRVHGERRPLVRDSLDRALVRCRPRARPQGVPAARPPRACSSSRATRSSAAATGSRRRSRPKLRTASSLPGCCTRASAPIRRRRVS